MVAGVRPGVVVAKRKSDKPTTPASQPAFERVEFQAPPNWLPLLDAAAAALGLSRSAYIRMACNRQMEADRRTPREGAG